MIPYSLDDYYLRSMKNMNAQNVVRKTEISRFVILKREIKRNNFANQVIKTTEKNKSKGEGDTVAIRTYTSSLTRMSVRRHRH